jgi:hypothetical protein
MMEEFFGLSEDIRNAQVLSELKGQYFKNPYDSISNFHSNIEHPVTH